MVPRAVSPVPTSSAPSALTVGRQPECRPDGLIGKPPTSGSATRDAAVPSAESCHVTNRTSVGVVPCMWVWHVVNRRLCAKSGCTTMPISPPSPRTNTSERSAATGVTVAPGCVLDSSASRPSRWVSNTRPSGRNPTSHTCDRPAATTLTCSCGVPVRAGPTGAAAGGELGAPRSTEVASGAVHPASPSTAAAVAATAYRMVVVRPVGRAVHPSMSRILPPSG
jgi:hypothetical protein